MFEDSRNARIPKSLAAVLVAAVVGAAPMAPALANESGLAPVPVNSRAGTRTEHNNGHTQVALTTNRMTRGPKGSAPWLAPANRHANVHSSQKEMNEVPRPRRGGPAATTGNAMSG